MDSMKRGLLILVLVLSFTAPPLMHEAKAMDPVTIAILTPIAIKVAQRAAPYVLRGLYSGGQQMISMGKDLFDIFRLPVGALQSTIGIPFGQFGNGVHNMISGGLAPFKFTLKALFLPLSFCNVGTS